MKNMNSYTKVVLENSFYAFLFKGLALVVAFFSTPAFIRYFNNNEVLGLWYTLLSVLVWVLTFDLGIGNGVRNHLVKALSEGNQSRVQSIISSGLASIGVTTLILTVCGSLLIAQLNLNSLFNIPTATISRPILLESTLIVFWAIMLRFFLNVFGSIYYALQKASVNNFIALCTSLFLFLYVVLFRSENVEMALLNISWAYLIISNIPMIIAGFIVFATDLKEARPTFGMITRQATKQIMSIGMAFFLCQVFFMVIANTNEFFISHYWSPTDTTDYSFYYRIAMLLSMLVTLALTPLWSMVTKAYSEKNYQWLRRLNRYFKLAGIVVVGLQLLIIPVLQPVMDLWLGKGQLTVSLPVAFAFAAFGAAFMYNSMVSTFACGLSRMKLQLITYGLGCIFKVAFIIIVASRSGNWVWVVWSNVFILVPYCILQQIDINRLLSGLNSSSISEVTQ